MTINKEESPYTIIRNWVEDATKSEPNDPDAACLATVDETGMPDARVVLVRKIDDSGFGFFTNYESVKGREILATKKAALNFHWKTLGRQIRVRGDVTPVSEQESDDYYATRPLGNRIGAWASQQSRALPDRETLINRISHYEQMYGETPPRPPHWGGFRLSPVSIEFWQDGEFRLHHRLLYTRDEKGLWATETLYP
ncbi:MAG TPA: pyridoxamine 5'-phosphate oxidase [Alphaproteobacteria bacterium]|nr:pyridoxamine 5'-phosphate oxidase [Alphaproteobacteria bacterium]HNS44065.1 pyridoxamine 5'-phosphate oxidase [Alphaproteobacteria bacterium]